MGIFDFLPFSQPNFRTPDFNPQQGKRPGLNLPFGIGRKKPQLPNAGPLPQGELSPMPNVPQSARPLPMPMGPLSAQMSSPPMGTIRSGGNDPDLTPSQSAPIATNPEMYRRNLPQPGPLEPNRTNFPSTTLQRPTMQAMPDIPQLPGHPGAAIPDNPLERARHDYVMEGAKRNPDGSLAGDKVQFKRSLKDSLLSALVGYSQGGLGGAAVGAIGSAINPMAAREQNFEVLHAPRLERQVGRQRQEEDRRRQEAMAELQRQRAEADIMEQQSQARQRDVQTQRALQPEYRVESGVMYNPRTGEYEVIQGLNRPGDRPITFKDDEGLYNPATGSVLRQPGAPQDQYGSDSLGIYNRRTGERKEERTGRIPNEAYYAANTLDTVKKEAEDAWETAKKLPEGEERKNAEVIARQKQATYNKAVGEFGETFGQFFETGMGDQGWGYKKVRQPGGAPRSSSAKPMQSRGQLFPSSRLDEFAAKKNMTLDQARQYITSKGYTIQ